jgi:clan AA aspartic protease (TIGR02281 family)
VQRFIIFTVVAATALAAWWHTNPAQFSQASAAVARAGVDMIKAVEPTKALRAVEVKRGRAGDFSVPARINGARISMVLDTGATAVMLTHETAKAAGLPLEVLKYTVEVETASGDMRAAPVTLDRLAVGGLVEYSVPALVAPQGQLKSNLLGMSFLNRLESWEVRAESLKMRGYP